MMKNGNESKLRKRDCVLLCVCVFVCLSVITTTRSFLKILRSGFSVFVLSCACVLARLLMSFVSTGGTSL